MNNSLPAIQPVSERFPALEEQKIKLTFFAPQAKSVSVAGNFNEWHPERTPLKKTRSGDWVVNLMFRSGQYEYCFLVDGKRQEDPLATDRVAS